MKPPYGNPAEWRRIWQKGPWDLPPSDSHLLVLRAHLVVYFDAGQKYPAGCHTPQPGKAAFACVRQKHGTQGLRVCGLHVVLFE
jgi:hypothetical protein